jgi:hypothetical protein
MKALSKEQPGYFFLAFQSTIPCVGRAQFAIFKSRQSSPFVIGTHEDDTDIQYLQQICLVPLLKARRKDQTSAGTEGVSVCRLPLDVSGQHFRHVLTRFFDNHR